MCRPQPPYHTEVYKGYTINILHDEDGYNRNPYEDGDGMYPMMAKSLDRRGNKWDYYNASDEFCPSTKQYRRHKKALVETLNIDEADIKASYPKNEWAYRTEEEVNNAIAAAIKEHDYDTLEAVGNVLGIPCLSTSSSGYSQGDYIEMLVVWTKEWGKGMGVPKKQALANGKKDMEMNAKVFGAWVWNDIFGFEITDPQGQEFDDNSCWGFIEPETYPAERMYVVQEARSSVDAEIKWRKKKEAERIMKCKTDHAKQLKIWIKHRVPLDHRQPLSL